MKLELVNRASRIQQGLTELIVSRRCSAIWRALALAIDVRSWPEADTPQGRSRWARDKFGFRSRADICTSTGANLRWSLSPPGPGYTLA